jgi:hypothetical protein
MIAGDKYLPLEEEKLPYVKKKNGDISKSSKKAKHKHIYDKIVLFKYTFKSSNVGGYDLYNYCSICGKIEPLDWRDYKNFLEEGKWSWSKEEYLKRFPDALFIELPTGKIPYFDIKNINEVENNE